MSFLLAMKARFFWALLVLALCTACSPAGLARQGAADSLPSTADIVYVTPTALRTLVPTAARHQPTATVVESGQVESAPELGANCEAILEQLYAEASDRCLAGPSGYFCSGGLPPIAEPQNDAFNTPGALVEAARVDSLRNPALADRQGMGIVWLRLEDDLRINALLIGDLRIRRVASPAGNSWRAFTVESGVMPFDCASAPATGALVLQSFYGQGARLTINGVTADINGTLIVLTQSDRTQFIAVEGQIRLGAFGQLAALGVGQQLDLRYEQGDWRKPLQMPGAPKLLEYELIEHLPVRLFERPVPIPQPGYAQTQGNVNMRAAPDISARLLYQVPAGETMSVLGISSNREWLHIRLGNGETGWMSAELLARALGEINQVYDQTPEPPQRFGAHAQLASVNVPAGGNLREAPDTAFRVKRTLPYGMQTNLLARSPYSPWVKVRAEGVTGWMALFTLETKSVISSLPIDYSVPLPPRATPTPSFSYGGGHAYPNPEGGY
ncbi:MAG: SH3 domain-containing protein [Chloroflexota bacterium]|nr:SH3 domain-containing protein [Chloroflexota bacterium]